MRLIERSEIWFKWLLWLLIAYSGIVMVIAIGDFLLHPLTVSPYPVAGDDVLRRPINALISCPLTLVVGIMVLRRSPNNVVGLFLILWSASLATTALSNEIHPILFSVCSILISVYWTGLIFLIAYFPSGVAVPRWSGPLYIVIYVLQIPLGILNQLSIPVFTSLKGAPANPLYVESAIPLFQLLLNGTSLAVIVLLPLLVFSIVQRYRRAGMRERQQIKWFVWWSGVIFVPYVAFYVILITVYKDINDAPPLLLNVGRTIIWLVALSPTVIIWFAVLRHRLYDIDIIIRRTLIYSILTGILGIAFFLGVTVTQAVLRGATGQTSDVAVVISTLGIAALFNPVRQRVQQAIDRRFYRTKYDAQKTLEMFALVMRDEVDAEKLKAALVATLHETMQPKQIALWMNSPKPLSDSPLKGAPNANN